MFFSYNRAWCESRVRWETSVPVLGFLDLSVLQLFGMYATDRQTKSNATNRPLCYFNEVLHLELFKTIEGLECCRPIDAWR